MALNLQQELKQAHALLEVMVDAVQDDKQLTEADRRAIPVGLDSLETHGPVSMEEVLADFGLNMADFEKTAHEPDPLPTTKLNG